VTEGSHQSATTGNFATIALAVADSITITDPLV
jgi:hypothetical protein